MHWHCEFGDKAAATAGRGRAPAVQGSKASWAGGSVSWLNGPARRGPEKAKSLERGLVLVSCTVPAGGFIGVTSSVGDLSIISMQNHSTRMRNLLPFDGLHTKGR